MKIIGADTQSLERGGRPVRLLVLRTDSDRVGVGELDARSASTRPDGREDELIRMLIGRDPCDTEALTCDVLERTPSATMDVSVLAAAQAAMSDLVGRDLMVPVHQLMGGRVRDEVRACAVGWMTGSGGLAALSAAARQVVVAGFTALRIDPFGDGPVASVAGLGTAIGIVGAVREALPDEVDIVVDVARPLGADLAIEFAQAIGPFAPLWLEDPFPTDPLEPLRDFGRRSPLSLAGGRRSTRLGLIALAMSGLVDHLVIDLARVGGLGEARRIAAIAEISHVDIVPVASGGIVAAAVALQLAATIPNLSMVEVRPGAIPVEQGMIAVDLGPGLGFRPMGVLDGEATR